MKKRVIIILVLFLIAVTGVIIGLKYVGKDDSKNAVNLNIYFFNSRESTLVAEEQVIRFDEDEDIVQKALEALIKGSTKNTGIMDKKTTVNSVTKQEDGVTVDFSEKFLSDDATKNTFAVYAVVKTLCQIPGIKRVKVTADSREIIGSGGTLLGFLSGDDINIEKDSTENKYVALYFADKESKKLRKEIRRISITDSQSIEQYIVNALIEGPKSDELESVLTSDTSLISVQTTDGTCFVNFSSGFVNRNSGSKDKEMNAVYAVVNSLTELGTVKNVQFLIDGKKSEAFGSISISGTFYRNESMIDDK